MSDEQEQQQPMAESVPLLYSLGAVYIFSFLSTLLFGTILMVLNLYELKKTEGILPTVIYSIVYLAPISFLINYFAMYHNFDFHDCYSMQFANLLGAILI